MTDNRILDHGSFMLPNGEYVTSEEIVKLFEIRGKVMDMYEKFMPSASGKMFIASVGGMDEVSGLPEYVTICPRYGADFRTSATYRKVHIRPKANGPELEEIPTESDSYIRYLEDNIRVLEDEMDKYGIHGPHPSKKEAHEKDLEEYKEHFWSTL